MMDKAETRPTRLSEWTIAAALGATWMLGLLLACMLVFPRWPEFVAPARINFLGYGLIGSLLCILVLIIAFASPYLGSVRVAGMGASLDINGTNNGDVIVQAAPAEAKE